MNATLTLVDPQSGVEVRIRRAELPQSCAFCGEQMLGDWIISSDGKPWVHLDHHQRRLLSFDRAEATHG